MKRNVRGTPEKPLATQPSEAPLPRSTLETLSRVLSVVLLLAGTGAGAATYFSSRPAPESPIRTVLPTPKPVSLETVRAAAAPASVGSRRAAPAAKTAAPAKVEPVAKTDPAPPTDPAPARPEPETVAAVTPPAPSPAAPPVQLAAVSAPAPEENAATPTRCLPSDLLAVVRDVETRFGPVALVSTTELHTDNHSRGSSRHRLHTACRAVDFKVPGPARAVTAYLRSRPEVAGINVYGNNGVIHIDYNEPRSASRSRTASNR